jgi:hypothetical protein
MIIGMPFMHQTKVILDFERERKRAEVLIGEAMMSVSVLIPEGKIHSFWGTGELL